MRKRMAACIALAWLFLAGALSPARAQVSDTDDLARRLERLERDVEALRERATAVPTAIEAIQDLEARLAVLEQQLGALQRQEQALPDAVNRFDELDARVRLMAGELATLRGRTARLERPGARSGTEDEIARVTHQHGFRWRSADGRHGLRLSGYVQPRYQLDLARELERSTLRLRRARLSLAGHVGSEQMSFALQLSGTGEPALLDYFLEYAVSDAFAVRVGQYKTPFTRAFWTSSTRLAFLERARAVDELRYDRDVQIGVRGRLLGERLGYYLGVGNGAGMNRLDDNLDKAVTARIDGVIIGERVDYGHGDIARTPAPVLMLGAGVVRDAVPLPERVGDIATTSDIDGDGERDDAPVLSASVDALFRYRGLDIALEALGRRERTGPFLLHPGNATLLAALGGQGTRRTYLAGAGQVTYVLPRDVLIGARLGVSRLAFLGVGGRASALPPADRLIEASGLVQLYRNGSRLVGLMYSAYRYGGARGNAPVPSVMHQIVAEAQLAF